MRPPTQVPMARPRGDDPLVPGCALPNDTTVASLAASLPPKVAAAVEGLGAVTVGALRDMRVRDLLAMDGMGPGALRDLRVALGCDRPCALVVTGEEYPGWFWDLPLASVPMTGTMRLALSGMTRIGALRGMPDGVLVGARNLGPTAPERLRRCLARQHRHEVHRHENREAYAYPWSPEEIATLKEMWGAGASALLISRTLGGRYSRNAVIGKVARLGFVKLAPVVAVKRRRRNAEQLAAGTPLPDLDGREARVATRAMKSSIKAEGRRIRLKASP